MTCPLAGTPCPTWHIKDGNRGRVRHDHTVGMERQVSLGCVAHHTSMPSSVSRSKSVCAKSLSELTRYERKMRRGRGFQRHQAQPPRMANARTSTPSTMPVIAPGAATQPMGVNAPLWPTKAAWRPFEMAEICAALRVPVTTTAKRQFSSSEVAPASACVTRATMAGALVIASARRSLQGLSAGSVALRTTRE